MGLCAGDEIRTRNTCLEGRCDDLFTTPAVRGIELWLFTGKHYIHEMFFITTVPNFSERKARNRNLFPSGVGGIRTLEPYETVNTLAGLPLSATQARLQGFPTRRKRRSETKLPMMDSNHL